MKKQVPNSHYNFINYVNKERFMSYYYQLKLIHRLNPKTILEIGVGNNFIKKQLSKDFSYRTLDFDKELKPDVLGDVTGIPLKDNSFDLIACFQVLEHLPFDKFEMSLKELKRVSKKHVIISLPYSNISLKGELKLPLLKKLKIDIAVPRFFSQHKFDGQHYWEIGKKGYSMKKIESTIRKHFIIKEKLNPYENKYHMFFVLEKK